MNSSKKKFIPLEELDVYKAARDLSKIGWRIYKIYLGKLGKLPAISLLNPRILLGLILPKDTAGITLWIKLNFITMLEGRTLKHANIG